MPRATYPDVMRYPRATRITAALILATSAGAWAVAASRGGRDVALLRVFLSLVFLAFVVAAIRVFGTAHRLVPGGIERITPFVRRAMIRWPEVVAIEWSARAGCFEVRSRRGDRIRVDGRLTGVERFARAALDEVPAGVIDSRAGLRQQLEDAARGLSLALEPDREESGG